MELTLQGDNRGVLTIKPFRKLWQSMAFSSLGDWLGLLATTALAKQLADGDYASANFAIAGVFIFRLLPSVILGPLAGVIADRFDRKRTMIVCDILRGLLFASIPLVGSLLWLYIATILIESITLFWSPAKEASVPNLVPRHHLESANQVSLLAGYGTAPIAALLFTFLAIFNSALATGISFFKSNPVDMALYINALSFIYSAVVIAGIELPRGSAEKSGPQAGILRSLLDGWKFVGKSKNIRGLVMGMLGAFIAAGAVIGLARTFVGDLGGGEAAYGILFAAVFTGLALGIALGPKVFAQFSRKRLFGATLAMSGVMLSVLALISNLVLAVFIVTVLGFFAGIGWVTGFTMLGLEVEDAKRGRTFAFVQSLIRVTLVLVLAVSPLIAAAIGEHTYRFRQNVLEYNGASVTLLIAGIIATFVGVISYRQMDDRRGISLLSDIGAALRGELGARSTFSATGLFIVFEGGEGAGKSTQVEKLREVLERAGERVVVTREPGGTALGKKLREILLSNETGTIAPRSEALLYAADRAHHVESLVKPALLEGAIVISDRYMDSSIAYQGGGRVLAPQEIARISRWATDNLTPSLTVLLDVPATTAFKRFADRDRVESEPLTFHERVRSTFLELAALSPERYLVIDATESIERISEQVYERVQSALANRRK
jgi:dTMP kinase